MQQLIRLTFRNAFHFSYYPAVPTQVFHKLSNHELATPQLCKKLIYKRIAFHSRVSLKALYHGKRTRHAVRVTFSEKKTKRFKRINKVKRFFFSEILQKRLWITTCTKALRCMKKAGSFDNYILTTKPKDLDSKIGQYYRTLMLRKINDQDYRVPYVIGEGKKIKIKNHRRYNIRKEGKKMIIPKDYRKKLITFQKKFGTRVEELNEEDYQKYLQLEKIKKLYGAQLDRKHPLLLQIEKKIGNSTSPQEQKKLNEMSIEARQRFINQNKSQRQLRIQILQQTQKQFIIQEAQWKQDFVKFEGLSDTQNTTTTANEDQIIEELDLTEKEIKRKKKEERKALSKKLRQEKRAKKEKK